MPWSEHIQHSGFLQFWDYVRVLSSHFEHKQGQRSQNTFEPLSQCLNTLSVTFFLPSLFRICLVPFIQFQSGVCSSLSSPISSTIPLQMWVVLKHCHFHSQLCVGISHHGWWGFQGSQNSLRDLVVIGNCMKPLVTRISALWRQGFLLLCYPLVCVTTPEIAGVEPALFGIWNTINALYASLWNSLVCLRRKPSLLRRSG